MKYLAFIFALSCLFACASKECTDPEVRQPMMVESSKVDMEKKTRKDARLIEISALVEEVDVEKRLLKVKGPEGDVETIRVSTEVKRLAEIKKGDTITLSYLQSVVYELREPTEEEKKSKGMLFGGAGRAPMDEAPAAGAFVTAHGIATIQKIDTETKMVTLKGAAGNVIKVESRSPEALKKLKVGDTVAITYTEALAVGVEAKTPS